MIKKMIVLLGLLCGFSMHAAELARMKAKRELRIGQVTSLPVRKEKKPSAYACKSLYSLKHLKFIEDLFNPNMTDEQLNKNHQQGLYPHYNFQRIIKMHRDNGTTRESVLRSPETFLSEELCYAKECKLEREQVEYINNVNANLEKMLSQKDSSNDQLVEPKKFCCVWSLVHARNIDKA
ncbi:hypothetical protein KBD08_04465 [Candidatus Babeliales bacterium]|nr:hypothetical protein [Candidatus Babeliales bacterium]